MAAAKNVGFAYGFNVHDEDATESPGSLRPDVDDIPEAGHLVRDIIYGSNFVASHLVHFYQLAALDFIDPMAANLNKPPFCPRYGPALNPGDPVYDYYYRVPTAGGTSGTTNMNVYLVAQYVLALKFRRMCNQIGAMWGGRAPFVQGLTPGGVATSVTQEAIDKTRELLYEGGAGGTFAAPAAGTILKFIGQPTDFALFVNAEGGELDKLPIAGDGTSAYAGTMLFDVVAVAMLYPEYFWLGNAYERFLAYGVFEQGDTLNQLGDNRLLSRGRKITGAKYSSFTPPAKPAEWKPATQNNVLENNASSWYQYTTAPAWKHPWSGQTKARPQKTTAYSWVKSPRYHDATDPGGFVNGLVPYEAGPLARMQVNGDYYAGILYDIYVANSVSPTIPIGPFTGVTFPRYNDPAPDLGAIFPGVPGAPNLGAWGLTYNGDSALDRYAARQIECWKIARQIYVWLNRLEGTHGWSPSHIGQETSITRKPPEDQFYTQSFGWTEAPRGALGHWMKVSASGSNKGKIEKYQCVVPSTWNASPRDANGKPGPAEKAMEDVYVHDVNNPLEILRVSHSWDFCTACAVHIVKPNKRGKKVEKIVHMDPTYL